ncbi:MAG: hypothetical protein J2O47_03175 [Acidimicrobiaceae bacterium]|nr:hypothetical protein [Acidimicrobiaceae bacterium]
MFRRCRRARRLGSAGRGEQWSRPTLAAGREAAGGLSPEAVLAAVVEISDDAACELLGIDPLHVANEGQFITVGAPGEVDQAIAALTAHPLGAAAARVGEIRAAPAALVVLMTEFGGARIVDLLVGDPLPRIC